VQVTFQLRDAVGGVADVWQERWPERGGVGGEPSGDELQGLGEFGNYLELSRQSKL
jgi:hypothetical protein